MRIEIFKSKPISFLVMLLMLIPITALAQNKDKNLSGSGNQKDDTGFSQNKKTTEVFSWEYIWDFETNVMGRTGKVKAYYAPESGSWYISAKDVTHGIGKDIHWIIIRPDGSYVVEKTLNNGSVGITKSSILKKNMPKKGIPRELKRKADRIKHAYIDYGQIYSDLYHYNSATLGQGNTYLGKVNEDFTALYLLGSMDKTGSKVKLPIAFSGHSGFPGKTILPKGMIITKFEPNTAIGNVPAYKISNIQKVNLKITYE